MSGGAWETVMANYNDIIGNSGFTSMPDSIYYDKYTSDNLNNACNGKECISHSLSETSGWYSDYHIMVTDVYQWLVRGGYSLTSNKGAGIFHFGTNSWDTGVANHGGSFRLVAINKK